MSFFPSLNWIESLYNFLWFPPWPCLLLHKSNLSPINADLKTSFSSLETHLAITLMTFLLDIVGFYSVLNWADMKAASEYDLCLHFPVGLWFPLLHTPVRWALLSLRQLGHLIPYIYISSPKSHDIWYRAPYDYFFYNRLWARSYIIRIEITGRKPILTANWNNPIVFSAKLS